MTRTHRSPGEKTIDGCDVRTNSGSPGGAVHEQAVGAFVQRHVAELAGDVGQGNFDPLVLAAATRRWRRSCTIQLGVGRSGDDQVDAVVGPRRAPLDQQAAVLQPHRARFVGLDPQRTRLETAAAADGD